MRRTGFLVFLFAQFIGLQVASAKSCLVTSPPYRLTADTVTWSLNVTNDKSCIGSFRFNNVSASHVTILSAPQEGQLKLLGTSFVYLPKPGFQGEDSFAVSVAGSINEIPGGSTIRVTITVAGETPQIAPPFPRKRSDQTEIAATPRLEVKDGTWRALRIGAGGFNTGNSIADDGTSVVRTDTYGAYIKARGAVGWTQLLTTIAMPKGELTISNTTGIYEVAICNSNTQLVYMYFNGFIYKSTNGGAKFTKTAFLHVAADANSSNRTMGRFMACDPADPSGNTVVAGTPSGKPWYSVDGGASWTPLSALAAPILNGNSLIAFDPSTSADGATPGLYISVYGTGVYHSTTGPAGIFTLTKGTPTTHRHLTMDPRGTVYLTTDARDRAHKFSSGAWSTFGPTDTWNAVAVDPTNTNRVALISQGGAINWSSTGTEGKFNAPQFDTTIAGDTPYLALSHANNPSLSNGDATFDPSQPGLLMVSGGNFGTMTTPIPTKLATSVTYTTISKGIEQLVGTYVLAPPGGSTLVLGSGDLPAWYKTQATLDSNADAIRPQHTNSSTIQAGISFDYAPETPTTIVGIMESVLFSGDVSSISTDGGKTWTQLTSIPPGAGTATIGGNIAMASATNWCWALYQGGLYCTTNGGTNPTWTARSLGSCSRFSPISYNATQVIGNFLAADKVKTGTYYVYCAADGIYKSTDGGTSFSMIKRGTFDSNEGGAMVLKTSPTVSGDVWYSSGYRNNGPSAHHPVSISLYRSTDGAVTWKTVGSFQEVTAVGFGAQVKGQNYPSIAVVGWLNTDRISYGIYQSLDNGVTWAKIGDFPEGNPEFIVSIDGDKEIQGKWYIAINGSGFKYYVP